MMGSQGRTVAWKFKIIVQLISTGSGFHPLYMGYSKPHCQDVCSALRT